MKLQNVLHAIDLLDQGVSSDDEWVRLSEERKLAVANHVYDPGNDLFTCHDDEASFMSSLLPLEDFDKTKLWNVIDQRRRNMIATADVQTIAVTLDLTIEKLFRLCHDIVRSLEEHMKEAAEAGKDPRTMDLLRFHGIFYKKEFLVPSRQSGAAVVSDQDDCRSSVVGSSLKANQIHHNMFRDDSELSFQNFKRFSMGGIQKTADKKNLDSLIDAFGLAEVRPRLMTFFPEALTNLKHARSFLAGCDSPLEPLTQCVFYAFLTDLLTKLNNKFEPSNACAHIVAGMTPIDHAVNVSQHYMRLNAAKRGLRFSGGSKKTVLKIRSDLVIYDGPPNEHEDCAPAMQQQKYFLSCKVNIEMKKWALLANSENKSSLTEVAAESMARRLGLQDSCPGVLFSLLTDGLVLYTVYHDVSENNYWISRSVNTAEEILVSICWLYLSSIGVVDPDVAKWEWNEDQAGGGEGLQGSKQSSGVDSIDEGDRADDQNDCSHQHEPLGQDLPVVTFDDDEREQKEEEERRKWQTFFLMENHRKYGTSLPLTEKILELHNAGQKEG